MLLSQIINIIMVRSGQFIVCNLEGLGLSFAEIWAVFESELNEYESYIPLTKKFNIDVTQASNSGNPYDFTSDPNNVGFIAPKTPVQIATVGVVGTTAYGYNVVSKDASGNLLGVTAQSLIDTGNATLSGINYNTITWLAVPGAATYDIYRTSSFGTPATLGKIGSVDAPALTFDDTAIDADGSELPTTYGEPPNFISKVLPVGFRQSMTNWWTFKRERGFPTQMGRVPTPRNIILSYRKPVLYLSEPGKMDIEAHYYRQRILTYSGDPLALTEVEIVGLQPDNELLDMLFGRFLMFVGLSRASFVWQDMPVVTNGTEMVQLGKDIYDDAMKNLYLKQDWWKALRP